MLVASARNPVSRSEERALRSSLRADRIHCAITARASSCKRLRVEVLITAFCGGILLLSVYSALSVIVAMQRNELLSNLAPAGHRGALSFNLVQQVITYVVLPSAVLLSRVFPDFGEVFARKLEPLLLLLR